MLGSVGHIRRRAGTAVDRIQGRKHSQPDILKEWLVHSSLGLGKGEREKGKKCGQAIRSLYTEFRYRDFVYKLF